MIADVFLDTNVLLYAAMGRYTDPAKYQKAQDLLATENFGTSAQVLAEFYSNSIRNGPQPLRQAEAQQWIESLALKPCQAISADVVRGGIANSDRYKISYWDGAIIAAAQRLGARRLYTEDLNHGQVYGAVTVVNPFLNV